MLSPWNRSQAPKSEENHIATQTQKRSEFVLGPPCISAMKETSTRTASRWNHVKLCQRLHRTVMTDCRWMSATPLKLNEATRETTKAQLGWMYALTGPCARTQLVKRHQSDVLAEHGGLFLLSNSFFPFYFWKRKLGGWDAHRCVITQRVCVAPTNLIPRLSC